MICAHCKEDIHEHHPMHGWPDFLPPEHELAHHSGATFHRLCVSIRGKDKDTHGPDETTPPEHVARHAELRQVHALYKRYAHMWHNRPRRKTTLPVPLAEMSDADREVWHRGALAQLWEEDGFIDPKVPRDSPEFAAHLEAWRAKVRGWLSL